MLLQAHATAQRTKSSCSTTFAAGGKFETVDVPADKAGHWRVEEEFVGAIRGTEKIRRTTFTQGVRYMEFTEAVAISYQTGQAVSLPLIRH